jgi:hypothetical protein
MTLSLTSSNSAKDRREGRNKVRLIKMIGFVAVAAVAMAFIGAGSAMANGPTALCKVNEEPCAAGNLTGHVHFESVGEPTLLTASPKLEIKCLSSLALGDAEALGNPTGITVSALTWTGCYLAPFSGTHNCTVKTENLGLIDVLRTAANLGTATALSTEVRVTCGAVINCVFGGASTTGLTVEGALHNGSNSHGNLSAPGISVPKVKGLCPSIAVWVAEYESLEHIFIST